MLNVGAQMRQKRRELGMNTGHSNQSRTWPRGGDAEINDLLPCGEARLLDFRNNGV